MLPDSIKITSSPETDLQTFFQARNYSSYFVLTDENTQRHCYPKIKNYLPNTHTVFQIKSGEENKNIETCSAIWQAMTDANLDRHSVVIIIGGGVLGDMGGFCAATYKRGVDFILIPTTLLAQADASIGGKLGIDFDHYKNQIGVFKEPVLTLLHGGFLETLPYSELRSGFAEVIKHALISDEALLTEILRSDILHQPWDKLLKQSAEFKYSVVSEDPFEKGRRKILNAGHTIGHALESYFLSKRKKILHGEAIAAGLVAEYYIATKRNLLDNTDFQRLSNYILTVYQKLEFEESEINAIASLCTQDKKNKGNKVLCVLPDGIGKVRWDVEISTGEIEESLSFYRLLQT
jgi:3-dehydroquinate synthase